MIKNNLTTIVTGFCHKVESQNSTQEQIG